MKKLISLFLLSLLALSMYGCEKKSSESEMISTSINNNAVHDEIKDISGNVIESDGVIASLEAGELVKKLSMLQNGTTLDDMIKIFGKVMVLQTTSLPLG